MPIVKPTVDNYPAIAEIFNQAIVPFLAIYTDAEKQAFPLSEDAASIAETAQSRQMLCAKNADGVVTGYAVFRKKNDQVVWISSLYVAPVYQRKGTGLFLLKAIEQYAADENCKVVALETHERADWAINFYMRAGYHMINDKLSEPEYAMVLERPPVGRRPVLAKQLRK